MDCGPAALKCLLEGFGIAVSYDRLREACQTDVDGTSIDTLEEVACQLGLDAEQVMLPPDHLFIPEAAALPALVVVCNPIGATHFVVVWQRHGSWVQLMDPATGRRWVSIETLLADLYVHTMPVPTEAWREWAGGGEFLGALRSRLAAIGIDRATGRRLVEEALADPGSERMAGLDAAVRLVASMVEAGSLRRGRQAGNLLVACREAILGNETAGVGAVPARFWSVRPTSAKSEAENRLLFTGAVLVRVRGFGKPSLSGSGTEAGERVPATKSLSPDLAAALEAPTSHPIRELWRLVREESWTRPALIAAALAVAASCTVFEVVLFRGLLDLGRALALADQRLAGAGILIVFMVLLLALETSVQSGMLRIGRKLEIGLRLKFLRKLARLGDRYFHSRLNSDMAERCHSVHKLQLGAELVSNAWRTVFQLALTAASIA